MTGAALQRIGSGASVGALDWSPRRRSVEPLRALSVYVRDPPRIVAAPLAASAVPELPSFRIRHRSRHSMVICLVNLTMKREAAEISKEVLALPTEARAALAGSLLDGLDTEVDEDAEAAWAVEVNRGVAELDSGAVKAIPWAEVRRCLAAR
jgi:putative addiction module component (TIGR02574 family)